LEERLTTERVQRKKENKVFLGLRATCKHAIETDNNFTWRLFAENKKYDHPPTLQICIVTLHPTEQEYLPLDLDHIVNRKNDLIYHDRTEFDERVTVLVSDYVTLLILLFLYRLIVKYNVSATKGLRV
jgi:hypothetical protein